MSNTSASSESAFERRCRAHGAARFARLAVRGNAGIVGDVLVQRAAARDVQHLDAAADRERRASPRATAASASAHSKSSAVRSTPYTLGCAVLAVQRAGRRRARRSARARRPGRADAFGSRASLDDDGLPAGAHDRVEIAHAGSAAAPRVAATCRSRPSRRPVSARRSPLVEVPAAFPVGDRAVEERPLLAGGVQQVVVHVVAERVDRDLRRSRTRSIASTMLDGHALEVGRGVRVAVEARRRDRRRARCRASPAAIVAAYARYGFTSAPGMRDSSRNDAPWPTMRNPHVRLSRLHASAVGAHDSGW